MNKVMTLQEESHLSANRFEFTSKQIDVLKNSICKGLTNEEFAVFIMACTKTQLDPFMKQIYAVKRNGKKPDGSYGDTMTIQTGIDGYRLIAERTGYYSPGPEPTYAYTEDKKLLSATAYIKKQTRDGTWHTVSASAYIDEYQQKTKDGRLIGLWATMPRTMLAKCAEAQALRKAFPAEMSGVYTKEEMQQADVEDVTPKISLQQATELERIFEKCDAAYVQWVYDHMQKQYKTTNIFELPLEIYERMKCAAIKAASKHQELLQQETAIEVQ